MAFQIEVKTGDAGPVILRGCSDGSVEFCKWVDKKDKDSGKVSAELVAYKFYANVQQAFDRIARMRIASAQANDLKELVTAIKAIRLDILREMGALN